MNHDMANNNKSIKSQEKSSHWILVIIGCLFLAFSLPVLFAIPGEVSKGNSQILIALVFPLAGLGMCFGGWLMRKKFLVFGPTPLTLSPEIGQVGGQIGGRIELQKPWQKRSLKLRLSCIHTYSSGSGSSSSTNTRIVWQEETRPIDKPHGTGSMLEFCFDVPADLPIDGKQMKRGSVHWEVMVQGMIKYQELKRHWKIPVEVGTKQSSIVIPGQHKEATQEMYREQSEASIEKQIQSEVTAGGIDIVSERGRNKSMSYFLTLFGLGFSLVGLFLFYQAFHGETMLWLMAPVFFGVGLAATGYGIFLIGRKLECKIIGSTVYIRRSLFGRILYTRKGELTSADKLTLTCTMSSQSGSELTEYMALYAYVTTDEGVQRKLKLVEGIEGRGAGEAMHRKVLEMMQAHS